LRLIQLISKRIIFDKKLSYLRINLSSFIFCLSSHSLECFSFAYQRLNSEKIKNNWDEFSHTYAEMVETSTLQGSANDTDIFEGVNSAMGTNGQMGQNTQNPAKNDDCNIDMTTMITMLDQEDEKDLAETERSKKRARKKTKKMKMDEANSQRFENTSQYENEDDGRMSMFGDAAMDMDD
jgi:hypothetical protein